MKAARIYLSLLGIITLLRWFASIDKPPQIAPPVQTVALTNLPAPPTSGDGVQVTIGNASPDHMKLIMKSPSSEYSVLIPPCQTCIVYTSEPPPECPADTVYTTFVLKPEMYQVQVGSTNGSGSYTSPLDLTNGQGYNGCFRMTYENRHKNMQDYR